MPREPRSAAASEAQRYRERLWLLREIDRAVLRAQSVDQTADVALRGLRQLVPYLRASVTLFDFEADEALLLATCSNSDLQLRAGARTQLSRASFFGHAPQGQAHLVTDLSDAPDTHEWVALMRSEGVRGYASFPLATEGQVIGALTFGLASPGPLPEETLEIATDAADQLAVAIVNARLHQQIRQHTEELEAQVARRTAALRLSEARLRAIVLAAPIGMLLTTPDGRILQTNPAAQEILGYDEAELTEMTFEDLADTRENRFDLGLRFEDFLPGQKPPLKRDIALRRKDGRIIWARLTLAHVRAAPEAGNLAIAMIEDVTEARKTQAALIHAERLAITGRLGASLAHEINNPLQAIIGCLGLADETLAEPTEAGRYLAVAREELRRVARTVAQLRDLQNGLESERVEPVALNDVLAQLITLNTQQCTQQGITITWLPASRLPGLVAAPDRIRQVFLNILLNALEAMPQGGRLLVRTAPTRNPAGVSVTVRDTGDGMAPTVLEHIFEPFFSTKRKGLGLGLFTSRNIIERHRGTIEVHSQPNHGTTFVVWLPAEPEQGS